MLSGDNSAVNASLCPPSLFSITSIDLLSFLLSVRYGLQERNCVPGQRSSNASNLTGDGRCFPFPKIPKATTTRTLFPTGATTSSDTSAARGAARVVNQQETLAARGPAETEGSFQRMGTGTDPDYTDRSYDKILYPCEGESPMGLPASIHPSWDAAMRVRKIDPNAFAVLLGRVLDAICAEQQAQGDTLYKRIENLADQGKVPQPLKEVAHKLRNLRNFGAHGNLGDLDPKDAPLLESLCRALLMYLYTVPALTRDAQKRLEKS